MNGACCVREGRVCVVHKCQMTRVVERETESDGCRRQIARVRWKCGQNLDLKTTISTSAEGRLGDNKNFKNVMCGNTELNQSHQKLRFGSKRPR